MNILEYWKLNPYLPFRLILKCSLGDGDLKKEQFCTWLGVTVDPIEEFMFFVRGESNIKTYFPIERITPLLYPMQSITVNRHRDYGYNFNPSKELFRKVFSLEDRDNGHITSTTDYSGDDVLINVEYNKTFLRLEISDGKFSIIPIRKNKVVTFDFVEVTSFLLRHHFDIYGMIYSGDAESKDFYNKKIKDLCG